MSTNTLFPVSGYARGAASVRPLTAAPRPWMSGVGVCPSPLPLGAGIGDAVASVRFVERASVQQLADTITRRFSQFKHDPGSTDLRPPV